MTNLAYGADGGSRKGVAPHHEAYLEMTRRKRLYGGVLLLFFIMLFSSGWIMADGRNAGGFWNGLSQVFDFPSEVLSEAWAKRAVLPGLMAGHFASLIETVNIAATATLMGALAAMLLALLATRSLARWPRLVPLFRRMMDALRAIPEIVVALVLVFILGGGPVPAVIAIALHTAGALGKLFSEVAENADLKPVEGLASVGASWTQKMWLGVIPQVSPNWLSYALMRFEINVRASAILGFVGSGGIGYDLKIAMQWGRAATTRWWPSS
ncbi:ABC transporter permease subunit [Pannonibacter sp. Pt2-lr]